MKKKEKENLAKKSKDDSSESDSHLKVVGIGASAGGLEALQEFFKAVPQKTAMAYVVVQHLSPDYKSLMDELLARFTSMKIYKVEDGIQIKVNCIYLIPPRKNMTIYQNKLFLQDHAQSRGLNLPIDVFFRSLAKEKGRDAIGVILSGTGSDGTLGIRAIKEAGGMVMVQDDKTAKFDGMPRSSISTGLVDYILPAGEMPGELIDYVKHPFIKKPKSIDKLISKDEDILAKILMMIRDYSGLDYSFYKENTILRRLEKRLGINRIDNLEDYIRFLQESDKEKDILFKELLIGVTRFFRDTEAFEILKEKVLPELFESNNSVIRVWSAGCSTGEEVYTIAILLNEYKDAYNLKDKSIKIFATDIDKDAIEYAGNGIYPDNIQADVDPELLSKYFTKKAGGYQIREQIRKDIVFATHNVLKDPPFSKIDFISCRNLFIYFKPEVQQKLLSMFYYSLNENGHLLLGSSESIGDFSGGFTVKDSKWKFFKYKKGFRPPVSRQMPYSYRVQPHLDERMAKYQPQTRDTFKVESVFYDVLDTFVPPSVLIDDQNNILHIFNNVNKYLKFFSGRFQQNLLNLVDDQLKIPVTTLTRKIITAKKDLVFTEVPFTIEDEEIRINIMGKVLYNKKKDYYSFLVSFSENTGGSEKKERETYHVGEEYNERFSDLERELQFTKENLQATVEELETSNEELQSSNEELIASNEELQSTNEELQSVNEELYTVNAEYQNKIEELTRLNNDINNLLKNTKIGTLYLDRKLCIRKLTDSVTSITHILNNDVGRPIYHMDLNKIYPGFLDDIEKVLEDLQPIEKEFNDNSKNWYLCKIMPYRTDENAIDGIIVTFININSLKKEEKKSFELTKKLSQALSMGHMAWWEYEISTQQMVYSDGKATMLGYTPEEFPDDAHQFFDLLHPDDYESTMKEMRNCLDGHTQSYEAVYRVRSKNGSYLWFYDRGGVSEYDKDKTPSRMNGIVVDITDLKNLEFEVGRNKELLQKVLTNSPVAKLILDPEGTITFYNDMATEIFPIKKEDVNKIKYNSKKWKIKNVDGSEMSPKEMPHKVIYKTKRPLYGFKHILEKKDAKPVMLNLNGTPVFDCDKNIESIVCTLEVIS